VRILLVIVLGLSSCAQSKQRVRKTANGEREPCGSYSQPCCSSGPPCDEGLECIEGATQAFGRTCSSIPSR
jgi:hypothetical protein